tara:strand:+ start:852 stop:1559 length:708 start_codon:yes stop_codon:yes gene_type:complete
VDKKLWTDNGHLLMSEKLKFIFIAPQKVFASLQEKPVWLLPWFIVSLCLASVQLGYYGLVDADYLLEQLVVLGSQPGISENDLRVILRETVNNKMLLGYSSAFGVFIGLLLTYGLSATYLYFVSKLTERELAFKYWFSLSAWCGMPAIISALAAWVAILSSGGQINMSALNPLTLSFLLAEESGRVLEYLDFATLWTLVLTIMGFKYYTGCSYSKASILVVIPYFVIILVWLLFI